MVDDMIDTAGTISEAVKVVMNAGASSVIVAATHGILSDPAAQRLSECGAQEVIVTDTLPIAPEKRFDKSDNPADCSAACTCNPRGFRRWIGHISLDGVA